ncbi:MAG: lipopolysaccharide biosynthesis protein [Gemmatimonadota bacterium]
MPESLPLYKRVMSAGLWNVFLRGTMRSLGFVRNVVLARLLAPDDFGLFGITLVVISMLERFSSSGMQSAVIQKRESVEGYLDTLWTIQVLRRIVLGIGLFLGAPLIASFFDEPRVTELFRVVGVIVVFSGLLSPGMLLFRRELEAKPQFIQGFAVKAVDLSVSIVLALLFRNVWALMGGSVAGAVTRIVLSYQLHPYRPRLSFDWQRAREMWNYGRWVFLYQILFFLTYRGDNLIIGKFLGARALGIYMLAYSIAELVTMELGNMLGGVAFPAYSRIQEQVERVRRAYLTTVDFVASITVPVGVVLCLFAEPITSVVLGERWLEAASVLPYLAVAGSARALAWTGTALYNAMGQPAFSFRMSLVSVGVTYALIFPLIPAMGLRGVALAIAAGQLSQFLPYAVYTRRTLGVGLGELGRQLLPALALGGVVGAVLAMVRTQSMPDVLHLVVGLGAAAGAYLICAWALWKFASMGPMKIFDQFWIRIRGSSDVSEHTAAAPSLT